MTTVKELTRDGRLNVCKLLRFDWTLVRVPSPIAKITPKVMTDGHVQLDPTGLIVTDADTSADGCACW